MRRGRETTTSTENKSRQQKYFKEVFSEAGKLSDLEVEQANDKKCLNEFFDYYEI